VLLALRCSSCLHAGVYRDFPSDGVLVTFHHTVYFYIKNINDKSRDEDDEVSKEKLINGSDKSFETV
jgi:hypothetical protein